MFCSYCGKQLADDALFCMYCGNKVKKDDETKKEEDKKSETKKEENEKRKTLYDGNINKCPMCGELLSSTALKCPSCGNEIRGRDVTSSIKEFAKAIASTDDENKKIELIKLFPIPNTIEDITEFMYLASSNFDAKYYVTNSRNENVASAWYIKISQCYKKAKVMFDPNDMVIIEKLYSESCGAAFRLKKIRRILIISGIIAIIVAIIIIGATPDSDTEDQDSETSFWAIIGVLILALGIISLVIGLTRKKTYREMEEARIAKLNKKNK